MMKSLVVLLAASAFFASAHADTTGMVGKSYIPKAVPPGTDISKTEFGNGYFICGGSVREDGLTHFTTLRKGLKTRCYVGNGTIALTRPRKGSTEEAVLDTLDIKFRKNEVVGYSCTGADIAISKAKDVEFYTDHLAAWKIVDNKFVPVTNLKSVRCMNEGYGV